MAKSIRWESANVFIEAQTRQIAREFKTSRPRPRNRAMGFYGDDRRRLFGLDRRKSKA